MWLFEWINAVEMDLGCFSTRVVNIGLQIPAVSKTI